MTRPDSTDPVYATARATAEFVWAHLVPVVGISVCWFLAALPVVTVGPATVGAYRAVLSLRETGSVDRDAILETVRRQFVHATLLGLLPLVLLAIAATYASAYLQTGALRAGLLGLAALYAAGYAWLVGVPTLVGLAEGESPTAALRDGYLWTARHGVGAVALGVVTAALFAVASLLTVAVALLFAGVAAAFHVEFVAGVDETDRFTTTSTEP